MTPQEQLAAATRIFLDTAPVIYFVEGASGVLIRRGRGVRRLDAGSLSAVTSPITLAECLIHPLRRRDTRLGNAFSTLLSGGPGTRLGSIDASHARAEAEFRAVHNLTLTDAFQLAVAIGAGCDVFLTNDVTLKRVAAAHVVTLDDLRTTTTP